MRTEIWPNSRSGYLQHSQEYAHCHKFMTALHYFPRRTNVASALCPHYLQNAMPLRNFRVLAINNCFWYDTSSFLDQSCPHLSLVASWLHSLNCEPHDKPVAQWPRRCICTKHRFPQLNFSKRCRHGYCYALRSGSDPVELPVPNALIVHRKMVVSTSGGRIDSGRTGNALF